MMNSGATFNNAIRLRQWTEFLSLATFKPASRYILKRKTGRSCYARRRSPQSPLQKCQNFAACARSRDFYEAAKDFMLPGGGNSSRSCNAQQI